jgi:hypothetical protein
VFAVALIIGSVVTSSAFGSETPKVTKANLKSKLITVSQLPSGWSVDNSSGSGSSSGGCFANTKHIETRGGDVETSASFENGNLPDFTEELAGGRSLSSNFAKIEKYLNNCKKASFTDSGTTYSATVGAMSFPTVGSRSAAYQVSFSIKGFTVGIDIVIFQATTTMGGVLLYDDLGQPDVRQLQSFAKLALKNLGLATSQAKAVPAEVGSLSDPVPLGQSASITGGWTVKVLDVAPDPASDQLNTPTAGYVYEIVTLQATRTASSPAAPSTSIDDSLVGPSRAERDAASSPLCLSGNDPDTEPDNNVVLEGGTVTYGDCISMSTADSSNLTLALGSFDSNGQTWFATK